MDIRLVWDFNFKVLFFRRTLVPVQYEIDRLQFQKENFPTIEGIRVLDDVETLSSLHRS